MKTDKENNGLGKENSEEPEVFHLKPYTMKEMREMYGVSRLTFDIWLEPFKELIGPVRGKVLTIPQVRIIIEKLDFPQYLSLNGKPR